MLETDVEVSEQEEKLDFQTNLRETTELKACCGMRAVPSDARYYRSRNLDNPHLKLLLCSKEEIESFKN
jgi:hypothetical protein